MKTKEQVKEILIKELNQKRIYCDNCQGNHEKDFGCDDCHRKYMIWRLSEKVAEKLAIEITE